MRHIPTADGHSLALHEWAKAGSSRGILLLHGLSQQGRFWEPVVRRLRSMPVAALDQRGHGLADVPEGADFTIAAAAADVGAAIGELGWSQCLVVGHSWGAAVAVAAACAHPESVAGVGLIDGGLWAMSGLGPRAQVRQTLMPPLLSIPEESWAHTVRSYAPFLDDEALAALRPTFGPDASGNLTTVIGQARHIAVLDGLLDYDAESDLAALARRGLTGWAVVCDERSNSPWQGLREQATTAARERGFPLVHRWSGAVHDVPLQWPSLVAGWIDQLAVTVLGPVVVEGRA